MNASSIAPRIPYPLAVVGACVGIGILLTVCDRFCHVSFGVLSYADPIFTGQAWWVLPNFMLAAGGMYLGALLLFARHVRTPTPAAVIRDIALFVGVYAASGLFIEYPRALLVVFVLTWLLRLSHRPDRLPLAAFGVLLAAAGCAVEGALTLIGEFSYATADVFHVPLWLAGLYLHGSFAILGIVCRVESRYGRLGQG